ncbi:MAG TPA: hypothetical protein VN426_14910 [Syntrophomonadaceae bacterium]|nr:hypothetical protein [Syntrophomonadaceae bacterium]
MVDLDFAFFNILSMDRRGLLYQKFFLDRLAPIFFPPRVARLLDLRDLDSRVCNIVLPLGPGNLQNLDREKKKKLLEQSRGILGDFNLGAMAVDRRLKNDFLALAPGQPFIFGDRFIQTLALVLTRQAVSRQAFRKIVIAGATDNFPFFLESICQFQLPVSIQTPCPERFDVMAYRLLYEKGCTVTNSYLAPESWKDGDLILAFNPWPFPGHQLSRSVMFLPLYDSTQDLAPELELQLRQCGLEGRLHHVAPVLESSLLSKAGYFQANEEPNNFKEKQIMNFPDMENMGHQMGLWDQFLDKAF